MSKVTEVLQNYIDNTGIILEQDPMAAPPAPPAGDPMAPPAIPPPPGDPAAAAGAAPEAEGEQKTKTLTDQGYVEAVRDMLELLSINPEDLEENDLEIFTLKVNPKNSMDLHKDLKDLISRYGSPTA